VLYRYDATWDRFGSKVVWRAWVKQSGGVLTRLLIGEFNLDDIADPAVAVRTLVERAIDNRG
jgi:hypothetical protein